MKELNLLPLGYRIKYKINLLTWKALDWDVSRIYFCNNIWTKNSKDLRLKQTLKLWKMKLTHSWTRNLLPPILRSLGDSGCYGNQRLVLFGSRILWDSGLHKGFLTESVWNTPAMDIMFMKPHIYKDDIQYDILNLFQSDNQWLLW